MDVDPTRHPQLNTSSRLLRLGESIKFRFHAPEAIACGDLEIFPRYLEQARPGNAFRAGDWARGDVAGDDGGMSDFVERYQRLVVFDFPKRHRVVFARSIDMADYYRRHFPATPRTVFVSRTDHVLYDRWWLCHWCNEDHLVPRERLPWETRMSVLMAQVATVRLDTAATMPDYAICLWGLPGDVDPTAPVETDAREALFARNLPGETHLVLRLDLKPGAEAYVRVRGK